eukprot:SAG11_NODE_36455_length_261_cov_0.962963_1_plen_30_part_01
MAATLHRVGAARNDPIWLRWTNAVKGDISI